MKQNALKLTVAFLIITLLLPAVLTPAQAAEADPLSGFTDLPAQSRWSYDGIQFCVENGYMNGTSSTMFSPGGNLTRGQLVTILYRMEGQPETEFTGRFEDVSEDRFFALAVEWAAENEIVNGIDETHFAPDSDITRQQIAAILYRYCGSPASTGTLESFPDSSDCMPYAVEAMRWSVESKLINGVSENGVTYLRPNNNATREQIATILMRLMNIVLYEVSLDAYEGLDHYMTTQRINTDIDAITAPFEDENGDLENDEAILTEAAMAVYDWAQELIDAGIVESATYNELGHSVAFFLKDGCTVLYLPNIANCYSGTSPEFSVTSVDSLGLISDAVISTASGGGSEEAANTIYTNAPEYTNHQKISKNQTTVNRLKRTLGDLDDQNTRVIFWRGHGGVYTDNDGIARIALVIDEKSTRTSEQTYYDDLHSGGSVPRTLASSGNHYAVNSLFFDSYLCQVDGGLFYCGSCQSANDGGVMAQILFDKGFDAYCGAAVDIFTIFSDQMMCAVAQKLTELDDAGDYTSIAEAVSTATTDSGFSFGQVDMRLFEKDEDKSFRLVDPIGYKAAYAEVLREKSSSYNFCLSHVDGDDIPELLVFQGFQHYAMVEVYTYYNGEACHVGDYPEYGEIYFSYKNNVIFGRYMQMGIYISGYSGIENGKEVFLGEEGSKYDNYEFMHLSYFAGSTINTKNINAMLNDISDFLKTP